jgi:hypothetical protein
MEELQFKMFKVLKVLKKDGLHGNGPRRASGASDGGGGVDSWMRSRDQLFLNRKLVCDSENSTDLSVLARIAISEMPAAKTDLVASLQSLGKLWRPDLPTMHFYTSTPVHPKN